MDSASPTTSGGTLTVMSTASSFVYGSVGDTIDGASLVGGASVGGALPTDRADGVDEAAEAADDAAHERPERAARDPQHADPERDDGRGESRLGRHRHAATAVDPAMAREARRGRRGVPYLGRYRAAERCGAGTNLRWPAPSP